VIRREPADPHHAHHGALSAAIRVVSGLTLLSRFAGLARDVLTARLFGDGLLGSAFRAAYAAPNLFRRLFGEGALSAAFLPKYTRMLKEDPSRAAQLASIVLSGLTLVTSALLIVLEAALLLVLMLAPDPERTLSFQLLMLMLPMMPMVCITAILGGMLQAHGKFGPPAAAPILLNVFQIAAAGACALFAAKGSMSAFIVGGAAVAASAAQILWSLRALRRDMRWTVEFRGARAEAIIVLKRFLPVVLGLGTLQLNTMLDTVIAMWPSWIGDRMFGHPTPLDLSSNAILSYTQTLYQFPLGVFGLAVATAVFPLLARTASDAEAFAGTIRRGLRLSFFIGLPASIGLYLVRLELCTTIFGGGWGGFEAASIERCADTLAGFSLAVWAYSLNHVLARAFYARGDTVTPMRVAMTVVAVNLALNLTLIWWLKEAGLAWSTAISALCQTCLLMVLCSRKLNVVPLNREMLIGFARITLCSGLMTGSLLAVQAVIPQARTWSDSALLLLIKVVVGAGVFAGSALLLRTPEMRWLTQRAPKGSSAVSGMSFE
jgi:putative peptidoglycan lipid II flippase